MCAMFLNFGKMGTFWLESVFVSYVADRVLCTIRADISVLSTHCKGFVFGSCVLQLTLFLLSNTVAGFIAEKKRINNTLK